MRVELVAVEADHAVAPRLLGDVQGIIRRANQCIAIRDAWVGPSGDTEARRPLQGTTVERECTRLDLFAHPLREGHCRVQNGSWKKEHELLASVSPDAIHLISGLILQQTRELLDRKSTR